MSMQGVGQQQGLTEQPGVEQASGTTQGDWEQTQEEAEDVGTANGASTPASSRRPLRGAGGGSNRREEALQRPRTHLYVGVGRAVMSRAEMFRSDYGVAISMVYPAFRTPEVPSGVPWNAEVPIY
jgi:hypothetical protein